MNENELKPLEQESSPTDQTQPEESASESTDNSATEIPSDADTVKAETKKRKLSGTAKILIAVAAVVLAAAASFGIIAGVGVSKAKSVLQAAGYDEMTPEQIAYQYEQIPGIMRMFAEPVLKKNIIEWVKANPYVMQNDTLLDAKLIRQYKNYDAIADAIGLSDDTDTNVASYIDGMMQLAQYEDDNNCMVLITAISDDFINTVDNWNALLRSISLFSGTSAVLSNSYWATSLTYLKNIKESSENAVTIAESYDFSDDKSQRVKSGLEIIRDNAMSAIGDSSVQWQIRAAVEDIQSIANDMQVAQKDIKRIVDELPEVF